jgi:hypothetical protein
MADSASKESKAMADRMSAEIWIGGKLRRDLLEEFPVSDLCLDWEGSRLPSSSEADLLAARDKEGLLHFADVEVAWGEYTELEDWLRKHHLPFRRHSEGKYEYSPELVEYRPDLKGSRNREVYCCTSPEGKPMVLVAEVSSVVDRMAKLVTDKRPAKERLRAWEKLFRKLANALPPELPPLPKFEIVDG